MDDQINFTLERIPKETREVTFSDGSVLKITAPAYMLEEMDTEEETDVTSGDETSNTTVLPPAIAESPINTNTSVSNSEQPTIEMLTAEIKMYLHIANQSIIEVGKRLILAKELVPHGDWANWLKHNFNLTQQSANRFMRVAERFGKLNIDVQFRPFDISNFKPTQLIALLALPEGDEEKFIAEKAAEGNPADQITIKQLRDEIKKWKDEFASSEKSNQGLESYISTLRNEMVYYRNELDTTKDHARALSKQLAQQKTVEVPPPDYEDLKREVKELRERPIDVALPDDYESTKQELANLKARENSFKRDFALSQALSQMFAVIPTLLNADNLQSVVSAAADTDSSSFKQNLAQLTALQYQLQMYLNDWEDTHINTTPIDRDVIIAELKHMALQDMKNLTSSLLLALVKSFGYDDMSQVPDELLPDILRKMKAFQAFLLYM